MNAGNTVGVPVDEQEIADLAKVVGQSFAYFGRPPEFTDSWLSRLGSQNLRVVRRDGRVAAGLGILPWGQWFGGRSVPCAGITAVGVLPEHRGQGVGQEMMRAVVRELRQQGTPLSVLYPSTWSFYRKVGYELAGTRLLYRLDPNALGVRGEAADVRPMKDDDLDAMRRLYERRARLSNGNIDRRTVDWDYYWDSARDPAYAYVIDGAAGEVDGYVVYAQEGSPQDRYEIQVRDFAFRNAEAGRGLLTLFARHGTMSKAIMIDGAPSEPLLTLAGHENLHMHYRSDWMLRMVDVPKALEARGYCPLVSAEIHFDVCDDLIAENHGRFVLEVSDGVGRVHEGGDARVKIDVRGLASLYSGYLSAEMLAATGMLSGESAELATASAVFAGPPPWLNDRF